MNPREQVIKIHPSASCKKVVGDRRQWRVYYTWQSENGATMHQLLGLGTSSKEAWKCSWTAVQMAMLRKLEEHGDE